jgi:hypothetical protein
VLFALSERHFIVTASHLFEDEGDIRFLEGNLAGPNTRNGGTPTTFGTMTLHKFKSDEFDYDITAIELEDPQKIATIRGEWKFLGNHRYRTADGSATFLPGRIPAGSASRKGLRHPRPNACCSNASIEWHSG